MTSMTDIGEKAFLRALIPELHHHKDFVNGFGHDISVVDLGLEKYLAFKIDRAPSPVALNRGWCDYRVWGRLAVVANMSDLLASAALPRAMMLSLVLPRDFSSAAAIEIVSGCEESCANHDVAFVGGDTKEGVVTQVVGAALGTVDKKYILGRGTAIPGDHLVIAGRVGGFSGALSILDFDSGLSSQEKSELIDILEKPLARVKEGAYVRDCKIPHASCDLSDGLAEALNIFCSDGAGITIDEDALPLHKYATEASFKMSVPAYPYAFSVGDWAIAYLVKESKVSLFFNMAPADVDLFDIGRFDGSGKCLVRTRGGRLEPIPSLINEQFRRRLEDDAGYLAALIDQSSNT